MQGARNDRFVVGGGVVKKIKIIKKGCFLIYFFAYCGCSDSRQKTAITEGLERAEGFAALCGNGDCLQNG